jgi:hypothetical protein
VRVQKHPSSFLSASVFLVFLHGNNTRLCKGMQTLSAEMCPTSTSLMWINRLFVHISSQQGSLPYSSTATRRLLSCCKQRLATHPFLFSPKVGDDGERCRSDLPCGNQARFFTQDFLKDTGTTVQQRTALPTARGKRDANLLSFEQEYRMILEKMFQCELEQISLRH